MRTKRSPETTAAAWRSCSARASRRARRLDALHALADELRAEFRARRRVRATPCVPSWTRCATSETDARASESGARQRRAGGDARLGGELRGRCARDAARGAGRGARRRRRRARRACRGCATRSPGWPADDEQVDLDPLVGRIAAIEGEDVGDARAARAAGAPARAARRRARGVGGELEELRAGVDALRAAGPDPRSTSCARASTGSASECAAVRISTSCAAARRWASA